MPMTRHEPITWLQLSDVHVFPEADTTSMLSSFEKLAEKIHPQFIVVTGDFRHIIKSKDYKLSCEYLGNIVKKFGVARKDVYLVPGNHDVNTGNDLDRAGAISETITEMDKFYAGYKEQLLVLSKAFKDYQDFVQLFYQDSELEKDDLRITAPETVFCSVWKDKINLIHINTALISDGKKNKDGKRVHPEILDINKLSDVLYNVDKHRPTIVLAHHGIESLHEQHKKRLEGMLNNYLISAYLHGDIHVHREKPIRSEDPSMLIPQIACGKSAPQDGDDYSDIGTVYYSWREDDKVEVQVFNWTPDRGFILNNDYPFVHNINEPYTFSMHYEHSSSLVETAVVEAENVETENRIKKCLRMIAEGNRVLKRRDTIDYNAEDWVKLYSYPNFSNRRNTPITSGIPFRTIVISPSGDGKSVMLQGLALLYAQKHLENPLPQEYKSFDESFKLGDKLFPISIRARDINKEGKKDSILEFAVYSVQDEAERLCIDRKIMETMCEQGNAVLLIDSLDEVYENKVNDFIEMIKDHVSSFPRTSIIVTSRNILGLRDLCNNYRFSAVKLCKFSKKQIDNQIEKRCFEKAECIKQRIQNNMYLEKMASSPIMLAIMLSSMSIAPNPNAGNVVEYLGLITDSIIKQRWKDFDLLNDEGKGIRALLSGLAWKLICRKQDGIAKEELRTEIEDVYNILEKIDYVFKWKTDCEIHSTSERLDLLTTDIGRRSGILNLDDNNTQYVFQDDLVKWYLGAIHVKLLLSESQGKWHMSVAEILSPLDKCIFSVPMNQTMVHTLVISVSLLQVHQQKAILSYLLSRATCSMDTNEISAINEGLMDLIKNTFGINEILNPREYSPSWEIPAVIRWLRYNGDTNTIQFLKQEYPNLFMTGC